MTVTAIHPTRRRYEKLKKSLRERDKALRVKYRLVR